MYLFRDDHLVLDNHLVGLFPGEDFSSQHSLVTCVGWHKVKGSWPSLVPVSMYTGIVVVQVMFRQAYWWNSMGLLLSFLADATPLQIMFLPLLNSLYTFFCCDPWALGTGIVHFLKFYKVFFLEISVTLHSFMIC